MVKCSESVLEVLGIWGGGGGGSAIDKTKKSIGGEIWRISLKNQACFVFIFSL
jgi:hypothetical protein